MDRKLVEALLQDSLEDHRLSRQERRELQETLAQWGPLPDDLAWTRHRAFALAKEVAAQGDPQGALDWLETTVKALIPTSSSRLAEAHFSPGPSCPKRILSLIQSARRRIDICVFTITDDGIADAILAAHERRVHVRVVTDDLKAEDAGSDIGRLARGQVAVRSDHSEHHMHHKFAIFDEQTLITGSYNWTRSAAQYNRENLVVVDDPRLVRGYQSYFDELWTELA